MYELIDHAAEAHIHHEIGIVPQLILLLPFLLGFTVYLIAVAVSNRKCKQRPLYRTMVWIVGVVFAAIAVAGPLAELGHVEFIAHMFVHLLLGMLAPLLMVLAAPLTLILRTVPVILARQITRLLKSVTARVITDPIVASLLNVGGLWVLYTTDLYTAMHTSNTLHILIHMHVFLAGYLFTISMIYIDPTPHRTSYQYRSVVLVIALAFHGILSKFIYANPPNGVSPFQAEMGGMLMFYGGDAIDVMIIFILCLQCYKASRPRLSLETGKFTVQNR